MQISNNSNQSSSIQLPLSNNQINSNSTLLKIIENTNSNYHRHQQHHDEPQSALQIQDVAPTASTPQSLNRKTSIGLTGPVTDL